MRAGNANEQRWKYVPWLLEAPGPSAAPGLETWLGGIKKYHFDDGSTEELYASIEAPTEYIEGSDVYVVANWVVKSAGSGVVRWGVEFTFADVDEVFPAPTTYYVNAQTPGVANQHSRTTIFTIEPPQGTALLHAAAGIRFFRDGGNAADTYVGDAVLLNVGFDFLVDDIGAVSRTVK